MNTIMPNPGEGTNVAGDTPQEVLFLVTDGVEDDDASSCSEPETSGRCQAPINPALCTTIKNRGIRIAVLYTDYYPVTANTWYVNWIEPFNIPDPVQTQIATNLQACASPGLFYDAGVDSSHLGERSAGALQHGRANRALDAVRVCSKRAVFAFARPFPPLWGKGRDALRDA